MKRKTTRLGVVKEKVYCRYVGEHSQRQRHLRDSRMDVTGLSCALCGEGGGKGRWERGEPDAATKKPKRE